jgi:hypothetical protein
LSAFRRWAVKTPRGRPEIVQFSTDSVEQFPQASSHAKGQKEFAMLRRTPLTPLLILCAGLALPLLMPGTAAADRADPWITFTTKITLLTAGGLDAASINVDTVQGLVTLHGRVDTAEQKAEAELLARQVDGVVEVRNLLQACRHEALR